MAKIVFKNIPEEVIEAVCALRGYKQTGIDPQTKEIKVNKVSKEEFFKSFLIEIMKSFVKEYQGKKQLMEVNKDIDKNLVIK